MVLGTKWKPFEPVEFKHVVEVNGRRGRMSDDSMLLGNVWNELQCAKGRIKALEAAVRAVREAVSGEVVDASDVLDSLFELVPEVKTASGTKDLLHRPESGEEPGSGITDLLYRPMPGEKPGGGVGPC